MGYARKTKKGSGRAMLEEMNKQGTLRGVIMPSAKSPFSALPLGIAQSQDRALGFNLVIGGIKTGIGMESIDSLTSPESLDRARAFNTVIGGIKTGTGMESIASLTPLTSLESLDSALRPTAANPFKSTAPYSVRQIPKRPPKKTAPGPIARLRNLGHPIAASYCKDAVELLELGYYKSSTHSSISAVESVARDVSPNKDRDLKKIINQMRADRAIHPAFGEMIVRLWGYCSDRPGMRHADYNASPFPAVGAKEARMLIGICPSIAEYLADIQD